MQRSWRTYVRQGLRSYPSLPFLAAAAFLAGMVYLAVPGHPGVLFWLLLPAFAGSTFVAGYVFRMTRGWPRLHEYRRAQYAAVWDELATQSTSAAGAAAGFSAEPELQDSGKKVVERIVSFMPVSRDQDVLELACGVARVGRELAPLCRTWTGCDISQNMLNHATRRLAGISNARLVCLSGNGLVELPGASADAIYCTNALPHFDPMERWRYVRDAFRVLRPGGRIYFDTVALDSPEGWAMMENNLTQRADNVEPPYMPIPSTPDEFLAYFKRAGFQQMRCETRDSLLIVLGTKPW